MDTKTLVDTLGLPRAYAVIHHNGSGSGDLPDLKLYELISVCQNSLSSLAVEAAVKDIQRIIRGSSFSKLKSHFYESSVGSPLERLLLRLLLQTINREAVELRDLFHFFKDVLSDKEIAARLHRIKGNKATTKSVLRRYRRLQAAVLAKIDKQFQKLDLAELEVFIGTPYNLDAKIAQLRDKRIREAYTQASFSFEENWDLATSLFGCRSCCQDLILARMKQQGENFTYTDWLRKFEKFGTRWEDEVDGKISFTDPSCLCLRMMSKLNPDSDQQAWLLDQVEHSKLEAEFVQLLCQHLTFDDLANLLSQRPNFGSYGFFRNPFLWMMLERTETLEQLHAVLVLIGGDTDPKIKAEAMRRATQLLS